jgi:predicted transposase YbfD/YdcC
MTENGSVFISCFGRVEDPRLDRKKQHSLLDIMAISICAAIAGADSWTEIADFGRAKEDWLRTFLKLPNGIPSHDTFGRVFSLLDPGQFEEAFREWVKAIQGQVKGLVSIDGKTARRSHDQGKGKKAIHVVSAWARESSLALGQVTVDEKSNEITAIPELVRQLDLNGCLVTIDAMGCQREIAKTIIDANADYLLAVKGNQETLAEDVEMEFKHAMADSFAHMEHHYYETLDKGHGRIEQRQYWYTQDIAGLGTADKWPGLRGMVMCRATRTMKTDTSVEDRYFITSAKDENVAAIAQSIRGHWGIENSLHWVLDVAFNEDQSRIRLGHAAENMNTIRKIALNTVKRNKTSKRGVKGKRKQAAWNNQYLEELLMQV